MGGARMEEGASWQEAQRRRHICSGPPPHAPPFPVPNISTQESGERGSLEAQKGRSVQPIEGSCPCPVGRWNFPYKEV